MYINLFFRKSFVILSFVLMTFNCLAWGPWDLGAKIKKKYFPAIKKLSPSYKDPILTFIHPEQITATDQFDQLLENLSDKQRKILWNTLQDTKDLSSQKITADQLKKKLYKVCPWSCVTWSLNMDYHKFVKWVAKVNGIQASERESATTFQLERRILDKCLTKAWSKLTMEQKEQILDMVNIPRTDPASYSELHAEAIHTMITTVSDFSSIAALITTASISPESRKLPAQKKKIEKAADFIIALHAIKAKAMDESGVDVSKYVLK